MKKEKAPGWIADVPSALSVADARTFRPRSIFCVFLFLLLLTEVALAQRATGVISGRVVTEDGQPGRHAPALGFREVRRPNRHPVEIGQHAYRTARAGGQRDHIASPAGHCADDARYRQRRGGPGGVI